MYLVRIFLNSGVYHRGTFDACCVKFAAEKEEGTVEDRNVSLDPRHGFTGPRSLSVRCNVLSEAWMGLEVSLREVRRGVHRCRQSN